MPQAVYAQVRANCHAALRELFVYVATPIEGPAKLDYGDLDVLVAGERRSIFPSKPDDATTPRTPRELMAAIKAALGAQYAIIDRTNTTANFAIPWPADLHSNQRASGYVLLNSQQPLISAKSEADHPDLRGWYVQVDVRICKDSDCLCWVSKCDVNKVQWSNGSLTNVWCVTQALFRHAHGDIWNLLGSTIRPFGLTIDEDALWLRIPEIEKADRKRARVMLTDDPVEVLHFLGMKVEGFWSEPFDSIDALFDYVTTYRLFFVWPETEDVVDGDGACVEGTGGEEGLKKLRSKDRRRMNGRPV